MAKATPVRQDVESVHVTLRFADPDKPGGILYAKAMDLSTLSFISHDDIEIVNARCSPGAFSLEKTGFELIRHETRVTDFESEEQIERIYKPEIEKLLTGRTGARRVVLFQPQGRWEDGEMRGLRQTDGNAHMDYTVESFEIWIRQLLGEDEGNKEMAAGCWGINTVWRGITPVERRPLAVCEGSTIDFENDFKDIALHLTPNEAKPFHGRNMLYRPDQRWY